MSVEFQWAMAIGLIILDAAAIVMAIEMAKISGILLKLTRQKGIFFSHSHLSDPMHHGVTGSLAGYAIYVYREGRWIIEADLSSPGYEPSPPTMPGSFEGHVLKKESTPSPGR